MKNNIYIKMIEIKDYCLSLKLQCKESLLKKKKKKKKNCKNKLKGNEFFYFLIFILFFLFSFPSEYCY